MESTNSSPHMPGRADRSTTGGFTAAERKRFRKERRAESKANSAARSDMEDDANFAGIPTSLSILTPRLMRKLTALASASEPASEAACSSTSTAHPHQPFTVPKFKVGTLEMYRHHPEAYDAFMARHDCSALRRYILEDVIDRILRSSSGGGGRPFVRVADFGCGTGRMEAMIATHAAIRGLYAYDGEPAMLPRCLEKTVAAARHSCQATGRTGVRVLPTTVRHRDGKEGSEGSVLFPFPSCVKPDSSSTASAETSELHVVVRPCLFQSLAAGFLTKTNHTKCHLVVCAWSLSYLMRLKWGQTRWHAAVDAVIKELIDLLDTSDSDAAIVIVETLGTCSEQPTRNSTLVQRLEDTHGFEKLWIRTDYRFANPQEAVHMARFFFGERVARQVEEQPATADNEMNAKAGTVLMECTGIWTLWKPRSSGSSRTHSADA